ncbi:zf-CGNR multi-domain protein [Nocardioides guangzhouensis]|uniref:Zf-CGNR multi-domain protein n=1 Tax=Nocardioides guangzhouensis TaxID=2497878 RepID=A0A4Q4Z916_9ACTN|nr:zf-CGNR multi-domain protein [Nocardioides guangzhouensis]
MVRDFVNTTDHETASDELDSRAALGRYLRREGLLTGSARATADDLDLALRLRSGLRRALELNHDGGGADLPALAAALADLPIALTWAGSAPVLGADAAGVRGALARIGIAAHEAAAADQWWRLKICSFDECEWAYYDRSKNRSRSFCEYGCGNKLKTRAYRARQRARTPG